MRNTPFRTSPLARRQFLYYSALAAGATAFSGRVFARLPEDRFADFKRPEGFIPISIGHWEEWSLG